MKCEFCGRETDNELTTDTTTSISSVWGDSKIVHCSCLKEFEMRVIINE